MLNVPKMHVNIKCHCRSIVIRALKAVCWSSLMPFIAVVRFIYLDNRECTRRRRKHVKNKTAHICWLQFPARKSEREVGRVSEVINSKVRRGN